VSIKKEGVGASNANPEQKNDGNRSTTDADSLAKDKGKSKPRRRRPQWSQDCKLDRVQSLRRDQIENVIRDRYGELALPADHGGRAILRVLLELGLDGVRAQELAPWCASSLDDMIAAAEANYGAWSTKRTGKTVSELAGERIELTFDEYQRLGIAHLAPCDAQRHEVQAYRDQRTRERNRKHDSKRRPKTSGLSERANAIFHELRYGHECSVRKLAEMNLEAFHGLDHGAARQAVLRAVRELVRHQLVEIRNQVGHRGLQTLYVRRPMSAEEFRDIMLAEDFPAINDDDEADDLECNRDRPPRGAAAETTMQAADEE
jgi:hypothetical protein